MSVQKQPSRSTIFSLRSLRIAILSGCQFLLLICFLFEADAADNLEVRLRDGRLVRGTVAEGTDDRALRLWSAGRNVFLSHEYPWDSIAAIRDGAQDFDITEFRGLAPRVASPAPSGVFQRAPSTEGERNFPRLGYPSRQASLPEFFDLEGFVANWDGDVENDGLLVSICPRRSDGTPVPVSGQLVAKLWGRRFQDYRGEQVLIELGRWNLRIATQNATDYGVVTVRLPFRNLHPDFQLSILPYATLNVHLVTQGVRSMEAATPVYIRAVDRLRDDWQTGSGQRFFPGEEMGRKIPSRLSVINY